MVLVFLGFIKNTNIMIFHIYYIYVIVNVYLKFISLKTQNIAIRTMSKITITKYLFTGM